MGYSRLTYEDYISHPECYGTDLPKWANELADKGYHSVCAIDFYDDIFGDDLEEQRMPEDYRSGEYAGIAIEKVKMIDKDGNVDFDKNGNPVYKGLRTIVTKGNIELYDLIDRSENFCIIAPISYAGRSRVNSNARYMYALCMEVDNLKSDGSGLDELIYSWERDYKPVPKPTYIVCSGNGLHLYYVFEKPIPLWRNVFENLSEARKYFIPRLWTSYVTDDFEKIQWGSVNEPFRCVGTKTKKGGYTLAFEIGEKVSIAYLNKFLPADKQLDSVYKSSCTLEEAKERYPIWYQRVIEKGLPKGHWNRYQPIYFNWIDKILEGACVGHRYNCLENLCSLAVQCKITPEQVEKDCKRVAERFERLTVKEDNHFTEYDILCALRTYHTATELAYRRKIQYISIKTGIPLTPAKRNGRNQVDHLKRARLVQTVDYPNGEWRNLKGRPQGTDKRAVVQKWRRNHPNGKKIDCERETGLSRHTVLKWWNS